ncbi:MAG: hypothetical protein ABIO82_04670 [Ginsengibacter sp.]
MSVKAKISLSEFEMELVNTTHWIFTKQNIIKKVGILFGEVLHEYKQISSRKNLAIPGLDFEQNGRISKGENYKGLPYVMLDYPALFSKEAIFAFRSMFWWGNFFSITLHISGQHLMKNICIADLLIYLRGSDFFICINDDEWEHTFDPLNYIPVDELEPSQIEKILLSPFFKISKRIELNRWNEVEDFFQKSYKEIIALLEQ